MPTVAEVLKSTGWTDEQIAALDQRAVSAFTGVMTTVDAERKAAADTVAKAEQERQEAIKHAEEARATREQAELVQRSNREFYDQKIVPSLTGWEDQRKQIETARINAESELAFYKKQLEGAKEAGYIPKEAPAFAFSVPNPAGNPNQPRGDGGRYVAGAPGGTPGSPEFSMEDVDQRLGAGLSNGLWAVQEYQRLTGGQFLPDSIDSLVTEATARKLPFRDYIAHKYDFAGKQRGINERIAKEHDDTIRKAADSEWEVKLKETQETHKAELEKTRRDLSERMGSNPDVRPVVNSRMTEVNRAVKDGTRPDPLKMNTIERHNITRKQINERIDAENAPAA